MKKIFNFLFLLSLLGLFGCDNFPRDPDKSFVKAAFTTLKVGVIDSPPWVVRIDDQLIGFEVELVQAFALDRGLKIEWVTEGAEKTFHMLANKDIQMVIGGLTEFNPWGKRVAFTRPYFIEGCWPQLDCKKTKRQHVIAVPQGENRLLMELESFLAGSDYDHP